MNVYSSARQNIGKGLILFLMFFCYLGSVNAATPTIHSASYGGDWHNPDTWIEGRIPNEADVVEINAHVVNYEYEDVITGLYITNIGTLTGNKITLLDDYENEGTILMDKVYLSGSQVREIKGEAPSFIGLLTNVSITGEFNVGDFFLGGYNLYIDDIDAYAESLSGWGNVYPLNESKGHSLRVTYLEVFNSKLFIGLDNLHIELDTRLYSELEGINISFGKEGSLSQIQEEGIIIADVISFSEGSTKGDYNGLILDGDVIVKENAEFLYYGRVVFKKQLDVLGVFTGYMEIYDNVNGLTSNSDSSLSIAWEEQSGVSNYDVYLDDVFVGNSTSTLYPLEDFFYNAGSHTWYVIGRDENGNEVYRSDIKCINVPGCVSIDEEGGNSNIINYSNTSENNSHTYTSQNTLSVPYIWQDSLLHVNNIENFQVAEQQTQVSSDAGDPVRLETGEFEYDNTLMRVPSEGMDFSLDVMYRNKSYYNGPIGNNFDFSYNKYLREDENGNIYFHDGRLGVHRFEKQVDETFAYNTSLDATLTQSGTTYQVVQNGKMTYSFGENKKLSSITDIYENTMNFSYNENDELTNIFDTQNREYTINYYDHSRIESITDFTGNSVVFEYFEDGDIDGGEHDLHNIVLQNSGEEKTISFTYTTSENFDDAHNIIQLIDAKGQTYVENTYQDNRVATQTYGNGTISYNYTLSGSAVIGNQVTDRNGNITDYVFDTFGNTLSRTKDAITYSYEYNDEGKLITETHPRGNGYSYDYDINGNLIEKRQKQDTAASDSSDDIVTSYEYDLVFNIPTKITLPNGLETIYTLDVSGNIISSSSSSIDSGNGTVIQTQSFSYDSLGQLISSTDTYGLTTTYNYSESLLISQTRAGIQTESYSYDSYGNILTKTDALGNIISYSYDAFYNRASEISPEGITTSYAYDSNNNKLSTSIILGLNTVTTQINYDVLDTPSQITQEISEGNNSVTQMSYDGNENLLEAILPNGAKQQFTYDGYDRVITKSIIADGATNITSNNYDLNGNLISQNANGELTQMSYDLFHRVLLVIDALGNTSSYSYDKMGNIVETQEKDSSGVLLSHTTMTYNQGNNLLSMTRQGENESRTNLYTYDAAGNILTQTDADGNTMDYSYDTLMRKIESIDPSGLIFQTTYDLGDRVISQSIISATTTLTTTYIYDDDGRVISQSDSDGNMSLYNYNNLGQVIQMTDVKSIDTDYSYDYRGKLLSESREGKIISYQYDTIGNMIELIDANGNVTQYLYNEKGNRIKEIHDDGTQFVFSYDIEGKLINESEPNGNTRAYIYDSLDRLATKNITSTGGVIGVTQENFSYDGLGRLESADNNLAVDIDFSYNLYGELISESQTTALGGVQTVSYSHDVLGNRTGLIYPSGSLLAQSYDTTSRLTGLVFDGEQILDINYNDLYKTSQTYGNSRATNYSYDTLGRLAGLGSKNYSYDTLGNMLSDGDDNYEYDTLNRLESMTYGSTPWENYTGRSYEYDFMGNRNKENIYYENSKGKTKNRPVLYDTDSINGSTYRAYEKDIKTDFGTVTDWEFRDGLAQTRGKQELDASGNLIRKVVNANWSYIYHYDGNNRLIQVDNESHVDGEAITSTVITAYIYDALGRRVQKFGQSNRTILYTYAGQQAIEERTYGLGSTTPFSQKQLIFTDQIDQLIATYNTTLSTGITTLYYYESDHLGSIESVYDATSGLVETYEYDVFGNVISRDATGTIQKIKNATSANTHLYTGREYDQEINLYYNRARYYDSQMGKFISRDPIGIADDVNLYSYVGNSPMMFVDRFGKEKQLLRDIYNGNSFVVELAARNLNVKGGGVGIHTWIIIHSLGNTYNDSKSYTIGGHDNEVTGMLDGIFNDSEKDFIRTDGKYGKGNYKGSIYIDTPEGFTDAQFVQNIYDEYKIYDDNQKEYKASSRNSNGNNSGNCNNFSTTLLYNASNRDSGVVNSVSNFNPKGANPGLGEAFSGGNYRVSSEQNSCSE